jgi:hypothetical protein
MKGIKWWLWVVGVFYLLEGGGLTLLSAVDRASAVAVWAPMLPPGTLDEVAIEALSFPSLFVNQSWVILGVMMLYFSRTPARAGMLILIVSALELFAWIPLDIMALNSGWSLARGVALLTIHSAIAASGILLLRANKNTVPV